MQTIEARKATNARYYQRTRDAQADKRKAWKQEFMDWYASLKRQPCMDCGFEFHHAAMQFDHIGTDKVAAVSEVARRYNKQALLDELAKCELVCANCHALRTWSRNTTPQ